MSDKNDYVNSCGNPATGISTTLPSWIEDFNVLACISQMVCLVYLACSVSLAGRSVG
jgi:hypothetical protein